MQQQKQFQRSVSCRGAWSARHASLEPLASKPEEKNKAQRLAEQSSTIAALSVLVFWTSWFPVLSLLLSLTLVGVDFVVTDVQLPYSRQKSAYSKGTAPAET